MILNRMGTPADPRAFYYIYILGKYKQTHRHPQNHPAPIINTNIF